MIRSLTSQLTPTVLLVVLSLLVLGGLPRAQSAQAGKTDTQDIPSGLQAGPQVVSATQDGLQFLLHVPEYSVSREGIVRAPGLEAGVSEAGAPALSIFSTLVALPPQAEVTVNVQLEGLEERASTHVRPAGSPAQTTAEASLSSGLAAPPELVYTPDRAVYKKDAYYPEQSYRLSEPMYYRDLRLVRLELFPLRYNAVAQTIEHAAQMHVSLTFHGGTLSDLRPAKSAGDAGLQPIAPHVINFDQAKGWRSLPAGQNAAPTALPTGQEVFKIAVKEDGIYEITCKQLRDAGMNVDNVDPGTFEMMYRGQPVAYDFVSNGDPECQDSGAIRFYGWAFDGSRLERQFLTENVFWLWAGGTPLKVGTTPVTTTTHPVADSFRDQITREREFRFTHTLTDNWDEFPNEADAWYWEAVQGPSDPVITRTKQITLPTPAGSGPDAVVTAEFLSRGDNGNTNSDVHHDVSLFLDRAEAFAGNLVWKNLRSVNVTTTVPMTAVQNGPNELHILYDLEQSALIFLNRITVEYQRRFVAQNDRLIIHDEQGPHTYSVGNFSADSALVWDISDRRQPRQLSGVQATPSNPYTYTFGVESPDSTDFIATNAENLLSPAPGDIEKYVPEDLEPQAGGADWVAISYGDFMPATEQLAAHRANPVYGGLATHVVDVQDVIEQYGYGLPIPAAIQSYLAHSLTAWDPAPRYVLLVGDGHMNPRQLDCPPTQPSKPPNACAHWGDTAETNYVLTDLVFKDEFAGLIPSDHTFALLSGDDLLPDVAVGRLAVNSVSELQTITEKIVGYEEQYLAPQPWQRNLVFVADNPDTGGNFCRANKQVVTDTVPESYNSLFLCLPENPTVADVEELQGDIHESVNPPNGAAILNYRGHGAIRVWGGNPAILNLDEENGWIPWEGNEPLIILSMDCWDGHFATPGEAENAAISEVFMAEEKDNGGSVAHWSSTGLGYDAQHTVLHKGFYEGLFDHGSTTMGQAINYSKVNYYQGNYHPSQLYSFTLQGDPAMQLTSISDPYGTYLPVLRKE